MTTLVVPAEPSPPEVSMSSSSDIPLLTPIVAHVQSRTDYTLDDGLEHKHAYNIRDYILFCLLFINAHSTTALESSAVMLSPDVAIVT